MAWYYGTFSCGCEGRINVIGPNKNRQYKIDKVFGNECEDCFQKRLEAERNKVNEEAVVKSKEMELPYLTGTEKQIAWANTLRVNFIDNFEKLIDKINVKDEWENLIEENEGLENLTKEQLYEVFDYIIANKVSSQFYINLRFKDTIEILLLYKNEIIISYSEKVKKLNEELVISENILKPLEVKHPGVVEIKLTPTIIEVIYEKNETFREIVKNMGYSWDGIWSKKIKETTGFYIDRGAELANKLLNKGFMVLMFDELAKSKALSGDFDSECTRWIYLRSDKKHLAINWTDYNNYLYANARKLPTSKWDKPSVIVNISRFKEVRDFASVYGFRFTTEAKNFIENYEKELASIEVVNVAKDKEEKLKKEGIIEILNSSRDILEDLKEED